MRFIVLDTETANLSPPETGGGVCELSIRELDENFNQINAWYSKIDPQCKISPSASGVHGILDSHVADEPTMDEFLNIVCDSNPFAAGLEPMYFIAYNAPFDWRFMSRYIECEAQIADVLVLARRYYPDAPDHKQQTLRVLLELPFDVTDAHSAAGDTQTLVNLLRRLNQDTQLSLPELCLDAQRKDPITKFPFGKHKGKLIADIARSDSGYISWCLRKMENLTPDLREALEKALAT